MRSRSTSQLPEWRWAPCAALVLGSLVFVALALLLIPDHLGPTPSPVGDPGTLFPAAPPIERTAAPARAQAFPVVDTARIARPLPTAAPLATEAPPATDNPAPDDAPPASDPSERHARRRLRQPGAPSTPVAELPASPFPDTPPQPAATPDTPPPTPADPTPAPTPDSAAPTN
jgi:hypothetical protein